VPDFDIANARFLLSFGADLFETWMSPVRYNRGYGEFRQGPQTSAAPLSRLSHALDDGSQRDRWSYQAWH
jgi:hypothetical protein